MASVYKTISGDVWDRIAKEVYGDESCTSFLMSNNQEYLDYFVFPDGIELRTPKMPEDETTLPEWRR